MSNRRLFIKDAGLLTLGLGVFPSLFSYGNRLEKPFVLPRSTPEMQGISSAGISKFLEAIKQSNQEFHSLMILRRGHVVAEGWWAPYSSEHRQQLYSLSKSFTGTAIGLAVSEGLLYSGRSCNKILPGLFA